MGGSGRLLPFINPVFRQLVPFDHGSLWYNGRVLLPEAGPEYH